MRRAAEFTIERMAAAYVDVYASHIERDAHIEPSDRGSLVTTS